MIRGISNWRSNLLLDRARPHMPHGEEILSWARVKEVDGRRRGTAYLSQFGCVIDWTGRSEPTHVLTWDDVKTWGVTLDEGGVPLLRVEGKDDSITVRFPTRTQAMADNAAQFLAIFGDLAPWPDVGPQSSGKHGPFEPRADLSIARERQNPFTLTKRVVMTVLGAALVLVGIALLVLPGPGILVTLAGLAVLSTEYDVASDAFDWMKERYHDTKQKVRERRR